MLAEINYDVVLPIAIGAFVFIVVASYFVNRHVWGPVKKSPEAEAWTAARSDLSIRDRWQVRRALTKGRVAEPRLAPYVLTRGHYSLEALKALGQKSSRWRWLLGGIWLLNGTVNLLDGAWIRAALNLLLALFWLFAAGYDQKRLTPKIEQSMKLNRELIDQTN